MTGGKRGSDVKFAKTFFRPKGFWSSTLRVRIPITEGKLPLSSLTRAYPGALGLMYEHVKGEKTSLSFVGNEFLPPGDGWGERSYEVVLDVNTSAPRMDVNTSAARMESNTSWDYRNFALFIFGSVDLLLFLALISQSKESEKGYISALSAWAGVAAICLLVVGFFVGLFLVLEDNFNQLKEGTRKLKEGTETIKNKLEKIEGKLNN
uniref:TAR DNA-binding protein 43 N-terminal domain-containing protein n=1 Tax=Meloidogyne incognita TaxID=6306 RepID=A0A914NBJ6_MELIC